LFTEGNAESPFQVRTSIVRDRIVNVSQKDSLIIDLGCADGYLILSLPPENEKIGIDFVHEIAKRVKFASN